MFEEQNTHTRMHDALVTKQIYQKANSQIHYIIHHRM